ncbi:MAG: flagellin [Candidatus Thermoplasmatota archaeon]|nr:flagellin [Candidatus Thermoplasmatota archaeon]MBU1941735.1 flagellin [Candidatus Thermoplasmatota archaeon]
MTGVRHQINLLRCNESAAIGIGALIVFIAMILVAGISASVIIQTMNTLQEQAFITGEETLRDVSSGLEVTIVSGYANSTHITQLAIFITPIAASTEIDLRYSYISLTDSSTKVVLNYTASCFSASVSGGLFSTINASNLSATTYGVVVIRDVDSSCSASTPIINERDLVVLLLNATACFSGISTRTKVVGTVFPEYGISGVIGFSTPNTYIDTIIELQP